MQLLEKVDWSSMDTLLPDYLRLNSDLLLLQSEYRRKHQISYIINGDQVNHIQVVRQSFCGSSV